MAEGWRTAAVDAALIGIGLLAVLFRVVGVESQRKARNK
jgi:hypothetical protein